MVIIKILLTGSILAGFSNLLFGLVIFSKKTKERQNQLFFATELAVGLLWQFTYAVWLFQSTPEGALFWSRMLNFGATLVPALFLSWIVSFLEIKRTKLLFLVYFLTTIFVVFSFSNLYISGVEHVSVFPFWPQANWLYSMFLFLFAACFGYSFVLLYKALANQTLEKRVQIKYIAIGSFVSVLGGAANFPFMYNLTITPFFALASMATIFQPMFLSIGLLKHNLFSVKVIATELLVVFLSVVLFMNIFFYTSMFDLWSRAIVFLIVIIIGYLIIRSVLKEKAMVEKMGKVKTNFVTTASHQLRSPVTAIKGYASMLLENSYGPIPERAKEPINRVFISTNRLVKLIDGYLNLSRYERGVMEYDFEKADLREIVETTYDGFKIINEQSKKGLKLTLEIQDGETFEANVDANKIIQVISNLIDNSLKYTKAGSVAVSLSKNKSAGKYVFKVQDTGIGMTKETQEDIFEEYVRADGVQQLQTEGEGLGLYVAKMIVIAHGGNVKAESKGLDKGSTFYLELPINFIKQEVIKKQEHG